MVQIIGFVDSKNKNGEAEERYFISQGRTIQSACKNFRRFAKSLNGYRDNAWDYVEKDAVDVIATKFSKRWCDGDYWGDKYPDLCFPKSNKIGIIEISLDLYNNIESALA